jgi:hypothetical protein
MGVGRPRKSSPGVLPVKNYRYAGWYVNLRTTVRTNTGVKPGGDGGIRTHDPLLADTPLAGEHLRPLGHVSVITILPYDLLLSSVYARHP